MEDEVITIRDLLSELSLGEKLVLLAKIYWRKFLDLRVVRFACIFCGSVYEWLFTQKSLQEVEQELDSYTYSKRLPANIIPSLYSYANGEIKPMEEFDNPTPADYNMTTTTLYDSKNFPEEKQAWIAEVVRLLGLALQNSTVPIHIDDKHLDYWFSQDYKPTAVAQMVIERGRNRPKEVIASHFIDLSPREFWSEK